MVYTDILVAVRRERTQRYFQQLSAYPDFSVQLVTTLTDARDALASRDQHVDLLVLDNGLEHVFELVADVRQTYPRLLIVLIDEEADFAMPGQADNISTDPFTDDDLARRIERLMSDRRLETVRADSLPPVREFVKKLRKASGESEKQQITVSACRDLGYDYVAFYLLDNLDPLQITLQAQDGPIFMQADAPRQASADDIVGWVAKTGQSRVASPADRLNYPLVRAGKFGTVACTPVGTTNRYGVLVVCRAQPNAITQQHVKLLEMISGQLAAAIAKE